jgi:hypothetical protein
MIFSRTRATVENGDVLEDPRIPDHGQIRRFDRVLAKRVTSLLEMEPTR